jgi:hypothetical protein
VVVEVVGLADVLAQGTVMVLVTPLGGLGCLGGLRPQKLDLLPLGVFLQYFSTSEHQAPKLKHSSASGKPAPLKQEATWRAHLEKADLQSVAPFQLGRGLEHHLPHLYSQAGGITVVVVQIELVVLVEVVLVDRVLVGGAVVETTEVVEVAGREVVEVVQVVEVVVSGATLVVVVSGSSEVVVVSGSALVVVSGSALLVVVGSGATLEEEPTGGT